MNTEKPMRTAKMDMEISPSPNGNDTFTLTLKAEDLPKAAVEHLASHLNDAVAGFIECIGAKGSMVQLARNPVTGEEKELSTKTFDGQGQFREALTSKKSDLVN